MKRNLQHQHVLNVFSESLEPAPLDMKKGWVLKAGATMLALGLAMPASSLTGDSKYVFTPVSYLGN